MLNDIHPSVKIGDNVVIRNFIYIGKDSIIGDNVRISNFCNIDSGTVIGSNTNLQTGVYIPSNTVIGEGCFFAAHSAIADEKYPTVGPQIRRSVRIGKGAVVGIGAKIIAVDIGDNSVVGAMSKVVRPVPPDEVWTGNPAKFLCTRMEYDHKKAEWESRMQ